MNWNSRLDTFEIIFTWQLNIIVDRLFWIECRRYMNELATLMAIPVVQKDVLHSYTTVRGLLPQTFILFSLDLKNIELILSVRCYFSAIPNMMTRPRISLWKYLCQLRIVNSKSRTENQIFQCSGWILLFLFL